MNEEDDRICCIKTFMVKYYVELSYKLGYNTELVDNFVYEHVTCTNYKSDIYLSFNGFNRNFDYLYPNNKHYSNLLTIKDHISTQGLLYECEIGLTKKQYNIFKQIKKRKDSLI